MLYIVLARDLQFVVEIKAKPFKESVDILYKTFQNDTEYKSIVNLSALAFSMSTFERTCAYDNNPELH